MPGAGYFSNDEPIQNFDRFAIYTEFRDAETGTGIVPNQELIENFLENPQNFHLLDGYTVDGNLTSEIRHGVKK